MKIVAAVSFPVYLAALLVLLWVARKKRKYYLPVKTVVSLLFVSTGIAAFAVGEQHSYWNFALLMVALLACLAGDVFLAFVDHDLTMRARPFTMGAGSFALAHLIFCIGLYKRVGFSFIDLILPLVLWGFLFFLEKKDLVRLKSFKGMAYGYTVMVGLMTTKAIEVGVTTGLSLPNAVLLVAGSTLFLVSDIILLFLYFGTRRKKWTRPANLSTYYMGLYLLALTAYWL